MKKQTWGFELLCIANMCFLLIQDAVDNFSDLAGRCQIGYENINVEQKET